VFIDEVESISPSRSEDLSGAERRVLATLLSELDGMADKGKDTFVLTVAATNTPWMIDDAVLSRFGRSVYVPLPDREARRRMLNIHIDDAGYSLACPIEGLVGRSEGYSGREIQQVSSAAIEQMLIEANPEVLRLVDRGRKAVQSYELKVIPIGRSHVEAAFRKSPPLTDVDSGRKYTAWRNRTGN
jgi:SpoVK/Ycf46/Vps4 family AAA+-type ATPase